MYHDPIEDLFNNLGKEFQSFGSDAETFFNNTGNNASSQFQIFTKDLESGFQSFSSDADFFFNSLGNEFQSFGNEISAGFHIVTNDVEAFFNDLGKKNFKILVMKLVLVFKHLLITLKLALKILVII